MGYSYPQNTTAKTIERVATLQKSLHHTPTPLKLLARLRIDSSNPSVSKTSFSGSSWGQGSTACIDSPRTFTASPKQRYNCDCEVVVFRKSFLKFGTIESHSSSERMDLGFNFSTKSTVYTFQGQLDVSSVPGHRSQLHPQVLPGHAGGPGFVARQKPSRNCLSADALSDIGNGWAEQIIWFSPCHGWLFKAYSKPCLKPSIRSPNMVSRSHFWMTHAEEQQSTVARNSMKARNLVF